MKAYLRVFFYEFVVPMVVAIPWLVTSGFVANTWSRGEVFQAFVFTIISIVLFALWPQAWERVNRWGGYP